MARLRLSKVSTEIFQFDLFSNTISDNGLLSLESSVGLMTSLVLTTILVKILISLCIGWGTIRTTMETQSSWMNIDRVLNSDVHAATQIQGQSGDLMLTLVNGTVYRYAVNLNGQFVRIQLGGGTSVIGSGVKSIQVTIADMGVAILCRFVSGPSHRIFVSPLPS